jgi:hypothetical protein
MIARLSGGYWGMIGGSSPNGREFIGYPAATAQLL